LGYQFDFGAFLPYWDVLLRGLWLTIQLTVAAIVGGVAAGIAGAAARTSKVPVLRAAVGAYVELIRNTPFLVQLFFIFFGLPELGIQLSETQAAFITMIVNPIRPRSSAPALRQFRRGRRKRGSASRSRGSRSSATSSSCRRCKKSGRRCCRRSSS
jgi:His/Glu/Gln/Arg/opine family amino acid ABC transporter permease subunit